MAADLSCYGSVTLPSRLALRQIHRRSEMTKTERELLLSLIRTKLTSLTDDELHKIYNQITAFLDKRR